MANYHRIQKRLLTMNGGPKSADQAPAEERLADRLRGEQRVANRDARRRHLQLQRNLVRFMHRIALRKTSKTKLNVICKSNNTTRALREGAGIRKTKSQ